jgi:hypothetical protein
MMKNIRTLSLLVLLTGRMALAQTPADLKAYIPKGYKLFFQYEGDLNLDSIKDKLLVLEVDKSLGDSALKSIFPRDMNYHKRPLLILIGQSNNTYKPAGRNDHAIVQYLGTPDPFSTIGIAPGLFIIQHIINDGTTQCIVAARFEWMPKQKDWYLTCYSHTCTPVKIVPGSEGEVYKEKTPKNFGKLRFEKYKYPMDIEVDEWGQ